MDDELLELQRQFEFAQQAKSSIRLSERNVVELVQKLQELHIIDFNLLHTVSGKEYITPEQLRNEMVAEIRKLGRVSVIDLADIVGVDLYHVEKQAQCIVSEDSSLMMIQGEVISQSYWDTAAEEINERLQECSQISIAELAAQLHVGSELISSVIEPRLGTMVKGRLEGGQLYTPVYVARVGAMVRGAARAITVPTNLTTLWGSLQHILQEMDSASGVAVEGVFFQSLFNGLVKEGDMLGSLRAGIHWTPTVFALAQRECVDSFLSQNSFISYEALLKLGIPQPVQYLQSRYPEGIPLVTVFLHPSMIEMLNAAAEDAIEHGTWLDSLSVLPASITSEDAPKILSLCPSLKSALKSSKALIFGDSYVFSCTFVKGIFDRLEKEMERNDFGSTGKSLGSEVSFAKFGHESSRYEDSNEAGNDSSNKSAVDKGSKKKKGKGTVSSKTIEAEGIPDSNDSVPAKSRKGHRKGKDTYSADQKPGVKKQPDKVEEFNSIPPEEWVTKNIMLMVPEFEELGIDDPQKIILPLAEHLRPMLNSSWKEKRKTLFSENVEKMRRVIDNLQKKLDEMFLNMQLYEKALDLFDDGQPTSVILHKHLLRTTATSIVDTVLLDLDVHNKLKNGNDVGELQNQEPLAVSPGEKIQIAKSFPGSLATKAVAIVEALEGKSVEVFMTALRAMAEESGMLLKKLDKKLERTLLHSYRKDLTSKVSAETDPVSLLPKVVSLLYVQIHNKALQAPGRAINTAISRLKEKLDDPAYKILADYQTATVALLALMSASVDDEESCSADRIVTKRELLESLMPDLKGLVLNSKN